MKTLKKIGKAILEAILITTLATTLCACKPKKRKDPIFFPPKPVPVNNAPVITSSPFTQVIENDLYSHDVDANDPDGDILTYSLTQAPIGMTINSNTGLIEWTPTDADSSQFHNVTVEVTDSEKTDTQSFQIYSNDKSTITFNIKDVADDTDLPNMEVKVGSNTAWTDGTGTATLTDILEGDYQVEITDGTGNETNYFTYKAGNLTSNKTKKDLGKLDNILKLEPTTLEAGDTKDSVLEHIADCIRTRYDAEKDIKKWAVCPPFWIYTREFSTGNPVDPLKIALVKDIINNELYKVDPLFTNPTIIEIDSIRPVGPVQDGYIAVTWNDLAGGGANSQNTNGYIITGGFARGKSTRDVWMQELTENVICGGEPRLSPLFDYSTILDDPTAISDYTISDTKLWKIYQNRPPGNKDLGTDNNHDVNPSTYQINP